MDAKWSWKPHYIHISNLLKKLGHRLSLFNRIFYMLDNRTRIAFYNGLVLPRLDYADTVWGDQHGLKSEMEKLQSFRNKFARKIKLGKMSSSEALKCLNWLPLAGTVLHYLSSGACNSSNLYCLQNKMGFQKDTTNLLGSYYFDPHQVRIDLLG